MEKPSIKRLVRPKRPALTLFMRELFRVANTLKKSKREVGRNCDDAHGDGAGNGPPAGLIDTDEMTYLR